MKGYNNKKDQNPQKYPPPNDKKFPSFNSLAITSQKEMKFSSLEEQYKHLKQLSLQKTQQMFSKQKMYRIKTLKYNCMKEDIRKVDKELEKTKYKITLELLQKNKNNKDSPLFYNENGLSPMELTLVEEKKHQSGMQECLVCMICFQDIEDNQIVINLPCEHAFHKDCAIQHLLGSKFCPNCSEIVDLLENYKKKMV